MAKSIKELISMQKVLMKKIPHGHEIPEHAVPSVVAGNGVIEETLEYLNAIGFKSWRPDPLPREKQLEELVDILFFYMEMIILSKFSWYQIVDQYEKKHAENLDRYERAKRGDYSWDDRTTKEGL